MSKSIPEKKIRIIFMGTPEFSLPGLQALIDCPDFSIVGVFTQTDKPVGRSQKLIPPPVKVLAQKYGIPVYQPKKIRSESEVIKNLAPDLIIVIAYGQIIPANILEIPRYACINVHASLLPKYRGAACLNAPIINGDRETGVSLMLMDAGLDTGPILEQKAIPINNEITLGALHDRLARLGAEMLPGLIKKWVSGKVAPVAQDNEKSSYVGMLKKSDGLIDWTQSADKIARLVRGLNPWPGSFTRLKVKNDSATRIIKILEAKRLETGDSAAEIGAISIDKNCLIVRCGQNSLLILKLQIEGKKALPAAEFIKGNSWIIGQKFI